MMKFYWVRVQSNGPDQPYAIVTSGKNESDAMDKFRKDHPDKIVISVKELVK
jgi:hypothetical protein